jgi:hypothetical protein
VKDVDENFNKVTDEFVTQRIGWHGQHESESANSAYMELRSRTERLRETLTEGQKLLLRECENAYRVADGETERFYYKAGFGDAIRFLLHFGEEQR